MVVLPRHRSSRPLDGTRTQRDTLPITFKKKVLSLRRLSYLVLTLLGLILVSRSLGRWSQPYDYDKLLLATPDKPDEAPFKGSMDEDLNDSTIERSKGSAPTKHTAASDDLKTTRNKPATKKEVVNLKGSAPKKQTARIDGLKTTRNKTATKKVVANLKGPAPKKQTAGSDGLKATRNKPATKKEVVNLKGSAPKKQTAASDDLKATRNKPVATKKEVANLKGSAPTKQTGASDDLEATRNTTSVATKSNLTVQESCGVYYFLHIPKNGGTSVIEWQESAQRHAQNHIYSLTRLYQHLTQPVANGTHLTWPEILENATDTVNLQNQTSAKRWLSVHQHHETPGLRYMMPILRQWKETLREVGCDLVLTTMLRKPLSRLKSQVFYNQIKRDKFDWYVTSKSENQARYLLFNKLAKHTDPKDAPRTYSPMTVPGNNITHDELEELYGYLKEFDIVGRLDDLDGFVAKSMNMTGWALPQNVSGKKAAPHMRKSTQNYEITAEMEALMMEYLETDLALWKTLFGDDS